MRVAVIGSRECGNLSENDIIKNLPSDCTEIISGGAKGTDELARRVSKILGITLFEIIPEYEKYGKRAPLLRNEEIVKSADFVLAFWDLKSKGTASVLDFCIKNYIPFKIISLLDGNPMEGNELVENILNKTDVGK